jgi:putative membrane protein
MMPWSDDHTGTGWGLLTILTILTIWALTVLTFALLRGGRHRGNSHDASSGRRILGERLARGEIDPAEYQTRLALLHEIDSPRDHPALPR